MVDGNRAILKIRWKDLGRIDCIPYEWFGKDEILKRKFHPTTGLRGGNREDAICRVEISGDRADLHYGGDHEQENRRNGMFIGTTRVTFHDPSRDGVRTVDWLDENGNEFEVEEFYLEIENSDKSKVPGNGRLRISLVQVIKYSRAPDVVKYALAQADGVCGDCKKPAPFTTRQNQPYLEVHHKKPLAQGGPDTNENVIALCPNCHRKRHHG